MINKIILTILIILTFGRITVSQLTENRILLAESNKNNTDQVKLNDTKIKKLEDEVSNLKTIIRDLKANLKDLKTQMTQSNSQNVEKFKKIEENLTAQFTVLQKRISKIEEKFKNQNEELDKMVSKVTQFETANNVLESKITNSVIQNIPKTQYYTRSTDDWTWSFIPTEYQWNTHPKPVAITLQRDSMLTFTVNGQMYTGSEIIVYLVFLKDKIPIMEPNHSENQFYGSYVYSQLNSFQPVNFSQQVLIKASTYFFEFGATCYQYCKPTTVYIQGITFTIFVQEVLS